MRRAHYLKGNKTCRIPQRILVFDTETRAQNEEGPVQDHDLHFGRTAYVQRNHSGPYSKPVYDEFTSPAEWLRIVESYSSPSHTLYVYAHNYGFDARAVDAFGGMYEAGYVLSKGVIGSSPTFWTMRKDKRIIQFIDTTNFFPFSLKYLGEAIGLPKLDDPGQACSIDERRAYCQRDVEITLKALLEWYAFIVREDLGSAALTLPGQAFKAFRHRFMHYRILMDDNPIALDVARKSYFGGRVECFFVGESHEHLFKVDVNSMYPFVMFEEPMPTILRGVVHNIPLERLSLILTEHAVCAHVDIETEEPVYPLRTPGRLQFPVGRFQTYLSTPELRYALEHGHIRRILTAACYDKAVIFREYVDFFYRKRLEAKEAGHLADNLMHKLFMNSLYGKFGQVGHDQIELDMLEYGEKAGQEFIDGPTGRRGMIRTVPGRCWCEVRCGEGMESHPAIAAHVTAYARMYLWRLIQQAGQANVLYTDTDSLICTQAGVDRLAGFMNPKALGALKVEGESDTTIIRNPKFYCFAGQWVHKGVRRDALEFLPGRYCQVKFEGIHQGMLDSRLNRPRLTWIIKEDHLGYLKGHVLANGRTRPFALPDDEPLLARHGAKPNPPSPREIKRVRRSIAMAPDIPKGAKAAIMGWLDHPDSRAKA